MDILQMELNDISSLHELRPEGWADVSERFRDDVLSPLCDPIKVVDAGKIIGVGCNIMNEDTVWLASIIVLPDYRNQGIGTLITKTLLERIDSERYETILLDATDFGYPVYRKLGFEVISEHIHLTGEMQPGIDLSGNIVRYEERYKSELLALDKLATGENRSAYLLEHIADSFVYLSEGKVTGACFPKLPKGMIIACTAEAGIELMKLRLREKDNCMMPKENTVAREFLERIGFRQERTSRRMRLGKPRAWKGEYIYNTISGARG